MWLARLRHAVIVGALAVATPGCDSGPDIECFCCTEDGCEASQPGSGLVEGGEALLETVRRSPGVTGGDADVVRRFHAFQLGGDDLGVIIYPPPGECFEYQSSATWPGYDISPTAQYVDWGETISISGPGLGGGIAVPRVEAPAEGLDDNRARATPRHLAGNWIYGGPTWQTALAPFDLEQDAEYELDLGLDRDLVVYTPPAYELPLGIGEEEVQVPTEVGDGWQITWEATPQQPFETRRYHFAWVEFRGLPSTDSGEIGSTPLFRCTPYDGTDGEILIRQEVIDAIPDNGLIVAGRSTYFLEALEDTNGDIRRFDLEADYTGISTYSK